MERRRFIQNATMVSAFGLMAPWDAISNNLNDSTLPVYCQEFTWLTYFDREGKEWHKDLAKSLDKLAPNTLHGMEVLMEMHQGFPKTFSQIQKAQLKPISMFASPTLHLEDMAERHIAKLLKIGKRLKQMGVNVIVVNPEAKEDGPVEHKTDNELTIQTKALDVLGAGFRKMGIRMLFHNHEIEMQNDAKEFLHALNGTQPENMGLCVDADWIYKGTGSLQTLYDLVGTYVDRIGELHLRQTVDGVWAETFGQGDIDYGHIADLLLQNGQRPALVLEQAVDDETPHTLAPMEAMKISLSNVRKVFSEFGK
ncbi:sugar phosphate isomerase/epimerase family protein [Flagellimonas sp.]|uniref:sugar phosphate isomerase/epimerase family protein n=1 Tax=Flagellimonas sp. TaxID=2058762 RepID=UPI003B51B1C6